MKTPREILLARHREAEPRLDDIRRQAVAAACGTPGPQRSSALARVGEACREFLRIPRLAWIGLGAAWTIIIALHIASAETSPAPPAAIASGPRRSAETLQALREQRRLFAELVGAASEAAEAEAPRFIPRPRSERSRETAVA